VATIDLNNLIRPKQVKYNKNNPAKVIQKIPVVYTDLHLDVLQSSNIGVGLNPSFANDILVDNDIFAIKNSINNILNTKPREKLLSPEFGANLEKYLFEPVTDVMGRVIGNEILNAISAYEPRIEVLNVNIVADPDNNQYSIQVIYEYLELKNTNILTIIAQQGGQVLVQ